MGAWLSRLEACQISQTREKIWDNTQIGYCPSPLQSIYHRGKGICSLQIEALPNDSSSYPKGTPEMKIGLSFYVSPVFFRCSVLPHNKCYPFQPWSTHLLKSLTIQSNIWKRYQKDGENLSKQTPQGKCIWDAFAGTPFETFLCWHEPPPQRNKRTECDCRRNRVLLMRTECASVQSRVDQYWRMV